MRQFRKNIFQLTLAQKIGKRIRHFRLLNKMTMQTLAFESDMEYMQLSRIELGKINTSVYQLFKICSALNIKIEELFIGIEEESLKL